MATKGKRQVATLTKRQLGYEIGRGVLNQISNLANGVRDLVEKGKAVDSRTGQTTELRCAPADIKRSWSPEQLGAVEEFISVWAIEPEPPPKPPAAPKPPREKKPKKQK
jgi:hypothetical protein